MTTPDLPDAAGAFTLTVTGAAQFLGITPQELLDLAQANAIASLNIPLEWSNERPALRFAPGLLTLAAEMLADRRINAETADVSLVAEALRAFLRERPPLEDFESSKITGSPMLAQDRAGTIYAHLKAEPFVMYVNGLGKGFILGSRVRAALERLGAVQVRGIHSMIDKRQRWGTWWRLPQTVWSAGEQVEEFSLKTMIASRSYLVPDGRGRDRSSRDIDE